MFGLSLFGLTGCGSHQRHDPRFDAALVQALASERSTEGRPYEERLTEWYRDRYPTLVDDCLDEPPGVGFAYEFVVRIEESGQVTEVLAPYDSDFVRCLRRALVGATAPLPPNGDYWHRGVVRH